MNIKTWFSNIVIFLRLNKAKNIVVSFITIIVILIIIFLSYKVYLFLNEVKVTKIRVEGSTVEVKKHIFNKVNVLYNQPILQLDLKKIQFVVSDLPWIEVASVYRNLNGEIIIFVVEKNPYFLWLDDIGNYKIIDNNNNPINIKLNFSVNNLIVIEKGQEALNNVNHIKFLIYNDFEILKKIKKLSYNGYRWDIHLKNGIIIKLPENNIDKAYDKVVDLQKRTSILDKKIEYIDVTSSRKLFINPIKN